MSSPTPSMSSSSIPAPRGGWFTSTTDNRPVLLTPGEAGELLRIAPSTLANWRSDGRADGPPFVKIGGLVRYRLSDLHAFIEAHTATTLGGVA